MPFTVPEILWEWLLSPHVTYTLLMLGIWAVIAAWATPGTGIAEGMAITCLTLAAIGLFNLPTNVAALALIFVAVGLYLLEIKVASHGILALVATLLLTIGSLFLFRTTEEAARVSRWLILGVSGATLGIFWLLTSVGLLAQLQPVRTGARVRPGMIGEARTDLAPRGVVYVGNEEWSAEAADGPIPKGARVRVASVRGLHLVVEKVERE